MTTTTWTTTTEVPAGPWAALAADIRRVLVATAAGGAAVTGPDGTGQPEVNEDTIAFTVTAPQSGPLTVEFTRAPGTGQAVTNAPHTTGLVLATLDRAARHWGALLSWETDADPRARAAGQHLVKGLFGAEDRAVAGADEKNVEVQAAEIVKRANDDGLARAAGQADLVDYLNAVIEQLLQERDGVLVARGVLNPRKPPVFGAAREEATP